MSKDILEDIFKEMPSETPSAHFRENLMLLIEQEVVKADKKRSTLELLSVIIASIALIVLMIFTLIYTVYDNNIEMFANAMQFKMPIYLSRFGFPAFIGAGALLLLIADFYLRQYFTRKKDRSITYVDL